MVSNTLQSIRADPAHFRIYSFKSFRITGHYVITYIYPMKLLLAVEVLSVGQPLTHLECAHFSTLTKRFVSL